MALSWAEGPPHDRGRGPRRADSAPDAAGSAPTGVRRPVGTPGRRDARPAPSCAGPRPSTALRTALSRVEGPQLGQNPRPLHEKATRRSVPHAEHRNRANPAASQPQRRYARNSRLRQGFGAARRSALREGGLLHESGQPFAATQGGGLGAERLEMLAYDLVEHALSRTPWAIRVGGPSHADHDARHMPRYAPGDQPSSRSLPGSTEDRVADFASTTSETDGRF